MFKKVFFTIFVAAIFSGSNGYSQEEEWIKTNSWTSNGKIQTNLFIVESSKWRIHYKPTGTGLFQVLIYNEKGQLHKVVTNQGPQVLPDHKTITGTGKFYILISADTTINWKINVSQYLTKLEHWHLKQKVDKAKKTLKLKKVGIWTGKDGSFEYEFEIKKGSWQLYYENNQNESLEVQILSSKGRVLLNTKASKLVSRIHWMHQNGKFILKIKSQKSKWHIQVLAQESANKRSNDISSKSILQKTDNR